MQTKAKFHELRTYLALRPSNYIFGRLIRSKKVFYSKQLGYIVSDPELAKTILRDSEHFSIKEAGGVGDLIAQLWGTTPTLLSLDGDEHKRVKFTLLELFKDDSLPQLIGEELARYKSRLKKKVTTPKGVDIAYETRLATNRITLQLLGVKSLDEKELLHISDIVTGVMGCIDVKYSTFTKSNRKKAERYVEELKQIAKQFYTDVDIKQDSIISRLQKLGYDNEAGYGFVAMFIIAGTVTVSASLPRIISLLIETDQLSELDGNSDHITKAVNEGLRYTTPGPVLLHGIKKDVVLGRHSAKASSRVMILLYNIMHDPHYTPKPFIFNVERTQNEIINGLWFGTGAHFCMGSVLAKKEITAAIKALAPYGSDIRIIGRSYLKDGINPGLKTLIVKA